MIDAVASAMHPRLTLEQAFDSAGDSAARVLTADLRKHARAGGWPEHIVEVLYVKHSAGMFSPAYPDQYASEIKALEYGSQNKPPRPVLRTWTARVPNKSSLPMDRELMAELLKTGELI